MLDADDHSVLLAYIRLQHQLYIYKCSGTGSVITSLKECRATETLILLLTFAGNQARKPCKHCHSLLVTKVMSKRAKTFLITLFADTVSVDTPSERG